MTFPGRRPGPVGFTCSLLCHTPLCTHLHTHSHSHEGTHTKQVKLVWASILWGWEKVCYCCGLGLEEAKLPTLSKWESNGWVGSEALFLVWPSRASRAKLLTLSSDKSNVLPTVAHIIGETLSLFIELKPTLKKKIGKEKLWVQTFQGQKYCVSQTWVIPESLCPFLLNWHTSWTVSFNIYH